MPNNGKNKPEEKELPKELNSFLSAGSFADNFTMQEIVSAINMLVKPGDSLRDLLMRGDIPSKRLEAHRFLVAFVHHVAKCREYHDKIGEEEAFDLFAGFTSAEGKRITQLVQSITAQVNDAKLKQNQGRGMGNYIKDRAGF